HAFVGEPNALGPTGRTGSEGLKCNSIEAYDGSIFAGRLNERFFIGDPRRSGRAECNLQAEPQAVDDLEAVANRIRINDRPHATGVFDHEFKNRPRLLDVERDGDYPCPHRAEENLDILAAVSNQQSKSIGGLQATRL